MKLSTVASECARTSSKTCKSRRFLSDSSTKQRSVDDLYREVIQMDKEQHPDIALEELFVELANRESEWLSPISSLADQAAVSQESTLESVLCSAETNMKSKRASKPHRVQKRLESKSQLLFVSTSAESLSETSSQALPTQSSTTTMTFQHDLSPSSNLPTQLETLANLRSEGMLTEVEFSQAKKTILDPQSPANRQILRKTARKPQNIKKSEPISDIDQFSVLDPSRNSAPAPLSRQITHNT